MAPHSRHSRPARWLAASALTLGLAPVPLADDAPPAAPVPADAVPWYHRPAPWHTPPARQAVPTPWMAPPAAMLGDPPPAFVLDPDTTPFGLTDVGTNSTPALADLDGDGDLDALIGQSTGNLNFFENTGSTAAPAFAAPVTSDPFGLTDVGAYSTPALADLDGDGDLDALVGENAGNLFFFENTGSTAVPAFVLDPDTTPFGLTDVGSASTPALADLDGDGDLDALIGEFDGNLNFFENTGSTAAPAFAAPVTSDPFGLTDVGTFSAPALADLDGDGDLDALVGEQGGNLNFFENTGSTAVPAFAAPVTNAPYGLTDVGTGSTPALADLDGDGDLDALIGERYGNLIFFENTRQVFTPVFALRTGTDNPFDGVDVGKDSTPALADLDGDGDLDALIGADTGNLNFFENTGSNTAPAFAAASVNPYGLTDVGSRSAPALADLDGDGDLDALIGELGGNLNFFENTGSTAAPAFASASANPFGLSYVGNYASPTFADLDGDGDLDAFVGEFYGNLYFFENTGTPTAPAFAAASVNPFGLTDVVLVSAPTLADLDGDGDLDALIGEGGGNLNFFENTGSNTAPAFAAASVNPFGLTDVGSASTPALADLDGDGDLDALVGESIGTLNFFENFSRETGTFTASINSPEGWHLMANPITGQTFDDLLGGLWTMGFSGADVPVGDPTVRTYDETNTDPSSDVGFEAIGSQTDAMTVGQGVIVFVFEDNDLTTADIDGGFPKAVALTGDEAAAPFAFSPTFTDTGNPNDDGWNLVGNPFGSTLDWDLGVTRTNIDATAYVWDPATSAYKAWNGTTGDLTDGLIARLQGFFVKANAASPQLTADTKSSGGVFLKGGEAPAPALVDLVVTTADGTARTAFLMFSEDGQLGTDPQDGYALTPLASSWLSVFTRKPDGAPLAINHLPRPGEQPLEIPIDLLHYEAGQAAGGTYTLTWPRLQDLPDGWRLELRDTQTGETLDLRQTQEYVFDHAPAAGKGRQAPNALAQPSPVLRFDAAERANTGRFVLVVSGATATGVDAGLEIPETLTLDQNYPNPFNPATTIRYGLSEAGPVQLVVYDLLGREVARLLHETQTAGWHTLQWDAGDLASGLYVYRLEAEGRVLSRSLMLVK